MWLLSPRHWGWITSGTPVLPLLSLEKKKKARVDVVCESNQSHVQSECVCIQRCMLLLLPYNAGKTKEEKKYHSALSEVLERLLTGTTGSKVSIISDEGGRHGGNLSHQWDFLGGRAESAATDGNTKQHSTSFRWLIWLFRPCSSGSDARTGCELLIHVSTEY